MQLIDIGVAVFRGNSLRVYQRFRRFLGKFFHIHNFALLAVFRVPRFVPQPVGFFFH